MITYFIIKINDKRWAQTQDLQGVCTACTQRPHGALSNTLCKRQTAAFVLRILKKHRHMAF